MRDDAISGDAWRVAFKGLATLPSVSPEIQQAFLPVWITSKMPLRVNNRCVLANALRLLLPGYDGPPIRVYRGAGAHERRRKVYQFSWTTDIEEARRFADDWRPHRVQIPPGLVAGDGADGWEHITNPEGGVVLRTLAPPEAILLVREPEDYYDEGEVVVDPFRLGRIEVVERLQDFK
jgi:hypothetical protein